MAQRAPPALNSPLVNAQEALQLLLQNRTAEAEALYRQLLPGATDASVPANLGAICGASGRIDEAVALLEEALRLDPNRLSALANLAEARCQKGEWQQAEPLLRRALELNSNHLQALNLLRSLTSHAGDTQEAIALARRVAALTPEAPEAHYNLGVELKAAGELAEARARYEQALHLRPGFADAEANLSMILLLQGEYERGLELREARLHKTNPVRPIVEPPLPRWDPAQPVEGPLLVVGEQGLGDMLQFLRYVHPLQHGGMEVWLCLPAKLVELARLSGLAATVLSPAELEGRSSKGQPACWVPLLSLPWHLKVTPQSPLLNAYYLQSSPLRRLHWQRVIGSAASAAGVGLALPVVGLHWQGNIEAANLQGRSLPLEAFSPLAALDGLALLSLQKGYGSKQLQQCSFRDRFLGCQSEVDACWDFVDTAAMVLACDLLITSDSALAHLAGGLGVPTWLLLHHIPDWRWGLEGERSFWYPSLRLFRQRQPGDWPEVIERVTVQLRAWRHQHRRALGDQKEDQRAPWLGNHGGEVVTALRMNIATPPGSVEASALRWPARVISLDPSGPRYQAFAVRNQHLHAAVFQAVRGDGINLHDCIEANLITPNLANSGLLHPGTMGAALSHRALWQQAAAGSTGMLILEDDVVSHPELAAWISANHPQLLRHDLTHFSINTDSILTTVSAQGLQESRVFHPKHPDQSWIDTALARTALSEIRVSRLLKAFGMCCYFISPQGAAKILEHTFPLTLATTAIPLISDAMPGFSIDRRLNAFYPTLQTWITLPFLAYTPNDYSSTKE